MIKTSEAIRTARALIGTPYSELDCINLIKKVIRTCAGGRQALHDGGNKRPVGQRQQERQISGFDVEAGRYFRREGGHAGVHGRGHGRRKPHRVGDGAGNGDPFKQEPGMCGGNRADGKTRMERAWKAPG